VPIIDLTGGNKPHADGFGHGTHMAGIIAGSGGSNLFDSLTYHGIAPGAMTPTLTSRGFVVSGVDPWLVGSTWTGSSWSRPRALRPPRVTRSLPIVGQTETVP
jgi:subtilisin family serine protease